MNYMIRPGESFMVDRGTNAVPFTTNWVSFFTVDGGEYSPPNRSSGVWVSIANVFTTPSVPAVTTATITAHNTSAAINYTLLCSASVDTDQVWWPVCAFTGVDGDYSANIIWTNSPNPDPAAWTNSSYGNVLATNVPYTNIGMPSMYFTVQDNPTTPRPMGTGGDKLEIQVKTGNTFTPVVNFTTNTLTKSGNNGNDIYELTGADIGELNLGWNGNDYDWWLQPVLPLLGWPTNRYQSQPAHAFFNLASCTNMTNFYACNFNNNSDPIQQPLDFSGLGNLRDIELFNSGAPGITLKGCSHLWRLCIESCNVTGTLDLSDCTSLQDLRAALNNKPTRQGYTNIIWPTGSAKSNIIHICVRDNPQLSTNLMSSTLDNTFTGLQELLFWNDNQGGALNLASSNLTYIQVHTNHLTEINFTNCHNLKWLWAAHNNLGSNALEHILGEVYSNSLAGGNHIEQLWLFDNNYTTSNGYYFFDQIRAVAGENNCGIDRPEPNVDLGNGWTLCQSRAKAASNLRFDFPNVQGNLLICYARSTSGDFYLDHDDAGNNWILLTNGVPPNQFYSTPYSSGNGTGYLRVYYAKNCNARNSNTIYLQGGTDLAMGIVEIGGASTSNPIYANNTIPGQSDYWNGGICFGPGLSYSGDMTNRMTMVVSTCRYGKMHETIPNMGPWTGYVPLNNDCGVFGEVVTRSSPPQPDSGMWWVAAYLNPWIYSDTANDPYALTAISLQH
jgi:hypothetical protein